MSIISLSISRPEDSITQSLEEQKLALQKKEEFQWKKQMMLTVENSPVELKEGVKFTIQECNEKEALANYCQENLKYDDGRKVKFRVARNNHVGDIKMVYLCCPRRRKYTSEPVIKQKDPQPGTGGSKTRVHVKKITSTKRNTSCNWAVVVKVMPGNAENQASCEITKVQELHTGHDMEIQDEIRTQEEIQSVVNLFTVHNASVVQIVSMLMSRQVNVTRQQISNVLSRALASDVSQSDQLTLHLKKDPSVRYIAAYSHLISGETFFTYEIKFGAGEAVRLTTYLRPDGKILAHLLHNTPIPEEGIPSGYGERKFVAIAWTSEDNMKLTLKYPEAFSIDPTRGLNILGYSLCRMIGVDGNGQSYYSMSTFIQVESFNSCEFLFDCFCAFYGMEVAQSIQVIATDGGCLWDFLQNQKFNSYKRYFHPDIFFSRDIFHIIFQNLTDHYNYQNTDEGLGTIVSSWLHSLAYKVIFRLSFLFSICNVNQQSKYHTNFLF